MKMNQHLLKTLALGLLLVGGGTSAWAYGNVAKIGSTEYATLQAAVNALTEDGQTIELLGDATWTSRMNKDKNYSVTIQPASGVTAKITVSATSESAQIQAYSGKTVTFDGSTGTSLTIDANGNTRSVFETDGGTFVLKDLTLTNKGNATEANNEGFIHVKRGNLTLNNVTISGTGNAYNVKMMGASMGSTLTLAGTLTFSSGEKPNIYIGQVATSSSPRVEAINASGLTSVTSQVSVEYNGNPNASTDYITGTGATTSNFLVVNWNYDYSLVSSSLQIVSSSTYAKKAYRNHKGLGYPLFSAAFSATNTGDVIYMADNLEVDSRINHNSTETKKTITVKQVPGKNITISRKSSYHGGLFLVKEANNILEFDGSGSGSLTIDNGNDGSATAQALESTGNVNAKLILKSVKLKKNNAVKPLIKVTSSGTLELDGCTFEDCAAETGKGVVFCGSGNVILKNANTFTNSGTNLYLETNNGQLKGSEATHTTPLSLILDDSRTTAKVVLGAGSALRKYRLANKGYELYTDGSDIAFRKWTSTSYELTIGSAGMATLVLPFNVATLPTGAGSGTIKAYKLTTASSVVSASEVNSITKDEPVLIVGTTDTYTFTGDAAANYSIEAPQNGALIGTYKAIDAADGNYVLQNGSDGVGFYRLVSSSNHVINPFRAYLSGAANSDSSGGNARLAIVFEEDGETTGIDMMNDGESSKLKTQNAKLNIYDLQGRRIDDSQFTVNGSGAKPGIYIVNGKLRVIK